MCPGLGRDFHRLQAHPNARRIAIECYPGVLLEPLRRELVGQPFAWFVLESADAMLLCRQIEARFADQLGNDPVFGLMSPVTLEEFFDAEKLAQARAITEAAKRSRCLDRAGRFPSSAVSRSAAFMWTLPAGRFSNGSAAARRRASAFQRREPSPAELYKRAFFLDWRAADHVGTRIYDRHFWIDGNCRNSRSCWLAIRCAQPSKTSPGPFSLVPFFDPGPWGGQWMRDISAFPTARPTTPGASTAFPKRTASVLRFGAPTLKLRPSTLVHEHPREFWARRCSPFRRRVPHPLRLPGYRWGAAISRCKSIRLPQLHPRAIRHGLYPGRELLHAGRRARDATSTWVCAKASIAIAWPGFAKPSEGSPLSPPRIMSTSWPARKHDHFLIPAGTIHCSGSEQHGARNQRHALHLHLQALGLGAALAWTDVRGPSTLITA